MTFGTFFMYYIACFTILAVVVNVLKRLLRH